MFSVQTGEAAFEHVLGMQTFDYWASHPEEAAIHDESMAATSALVAGFEILKRYDFSAFRIIVDVGGGTGSPSAILTARPDFVESFLTFHMWSRVPAR